MNGKNVGLIGRRRLITKEGVAKMNDELTNDTIRLQAGFQKALSGKNRTRSWMEFTCSDGLNPDFS